MGLILTELVEANRKALEKEAGPFLQQWHGESYAGLRSEDGMTVSPDAVVVGKCFTTPTGQVRRVTKILEDRVRYEARGKKTIRGDWPTREKFAADMDREVSCISTGEFTWKARLARPGAC